MELHDGRLTAPPIPAPLVARPAVSVCIAHFNHGKYLPALLQSLANNSEAADQVIVIDDASSCEESRLAFDREKEKYPSWTFVRNAANKGPLECRHDAVALATGEHLIFMDSDNVAAPNMIECFKRGRRSQAPMS